MTWFVVSLLNLIIVGLIVWLDIRTLKSLNAESKARHEALIKLLGEIKPK